MQYTDEQVARVTHEANRAMQKIQALDGVPVAPAWDDFPPDEQQGVINGVTSARRGGVTPEMLHQQWMDEKLANGWTYGPVKDSEAKTHPALVPYDQLPEEQRDKDRLFQAICVMLTPPAFAPPPDPVAAIRAQAIPDGGF